MALTALPYLEIPRLLVILDQVVLVQHQGCSVHQVQSALVQQRISFEVVVGDPVEGGGPQHPDVEVRVAQPVHSILQRPINRRSAPASTLKRHASEHVLHSYTRSHDGNTHTQATCCLCGRSFSFHHPVVFPIHASPRDQLLVEHFALQPQEGPASFPQPLHQVWR